MNFQTLKQYKPSKSALVIFLLLATLIPLMNNSVSTSALQSGEYPTERLVYGNPDFGESQYSLFADHSTFANLRIDYINDNIPNWASYYDFSSNQQVKTSLDNPIGFETDTAFQLDISSTLSHYQQTGDFEAQTNYIGYYDTEWFEYTFQITGPDGAIDGTALYDYIDWANSGFILGESHEFTNLVDKTANFIFDNAVEATAAALASKLPGLEAPLNAVADKIVDIVSFDVEQDDSEFTMVIDKNAQLNGKSALRIYIANDQGSFWKKKGNSFGAFHIRLNPINIAESKRGIFTFNSQFRSETHYQIKKLVDDEGGAAYYSTMEDARQINSFNYEPFNILMNKPNDKLRVVKTDSDPSSVSGLLPTVDGISLHNGNNWFAIWGDESSSSISASTTSYANDYVFSGWSIDNDVLSETSTSLSTTFSDEMIILKSHYQSNDAPTGSILSPSDSSTVSGTITITASASDNQGVDRVEFHVGPYYSDTDETANSNGHYTDSFGTSYYSDGIYSVTIVIYDIYGKSSTYSISIFIDNVDDSDDGDDDDDGGWDAPDPCSGSHCMTF